LRMVLENQTILYDYEMEVDMGLKMHFERLRDKFYVAKREENVLIDSTYMFFANLGDSWTARFSLELLR